MLVVPPSHEGSTDTERAVRDVLLRSTLPGLPPEIATEATLCRARIFQSGTCAIIAAGSALLLWYATSLLTHGSGTGIVLLLIGLTGWFTASVPGLALALLAFKDASAEERPVTLILATVNGALVVLFFMMGAHYARP